MQDQHSMNNGLSFTNIAEEIIIAIDNIYDELRDLVGDNDWPVMEEQLQKYLTWLDNVDNSKEASNIVILIEDYFAKYHAAHERLREELAALRGTDYVPNQFLRFALSNLLSKPVIRYIDALCPKRIGLGTKRFPVTVRLTVEPPTWAQNISPITVHSRKQIEVRLDNASAFEILESDTKYLSVKDEEDSDEIVFYLRPKVVGQTSIVLNFVQGGNYVGTTTIPIDITDDDSICVMQQHLQDLVCLPEGLPPPDRILYIGLDLVNGRELLTFSLFEEGHLRERFEAVRLFASPAEYTDDLMSELNSMTHRVSLNKSTDNSADFELQIKQIGWKLWHDLIPSRLKALYLDERDKWRDSTLLLLSDEPHIPWELVRPFHNLSLVEDEDVWSVTMNMTRWLRRDNGSAMLPPQPNFTVSSWASLIPSDSSLAHIKAEQSMLEQVFSDARSRCPDKPSRDSVRNLLASGDYDWLHVAAHGVVSSSMMYDKAYVKLQDWDLHPREFLGPRVVPHIQRNRPGFFFNTCHGGRQSWSLTGIGGWSSHLIGIGAGLFLGPLWTVDDGAAFKFATELYASLVGGDTVATAVRKARLAAKRDGDPSWLAYSIFAHPNATLQICPPDLD